VKIKLTNTHDVSILLSMTAIAIQANKIIESESLFVDLENALAYRSRDDYYFKFLSLKISYYLKKEEFKEALDFLELKISLEREKNTLNRSRIFILFTKVYTQMGRLGKSNWALSQVFNENSLDYEWKYMYKAEKIQLKIFKGLYDDALLLVNENNLLAHELRQEELIVQNLLFKSFIYKQKGMHKDALKTIKAAYVKLNSVYDVELKVNIYSQLGIVYIYMAKTSEGFRYLFKALELCNELNNRSLKTKLISNIGTAYEFIADYNKSYEMHKQALNFSVELDNEYLFANSLTNLAGILVEFQHFKLAKKYFKLALNSFKELDLARGRITIYNNLGNFYYYKGEYNKAISYYEKALSLEYKIDDKYGLANSFNNLGNTYQELGNLHLAYKFYIKTLENLQGISDDVMLGAILNNLGNLKLAIGSFPKAKEFYNEALKVNKKTRFDEAIAMNLSNLAQVSEREGSYDNALEYYQSAIKYEIKIGKQVNLLNHYESIIAILIEQQDLIKAEKILSKALGIAEKMNDKNSQAGLQFQFAKLAAYNKKYEHAMQYYSASAEIYKEEENYTAAGECYFNVATLLYDKDFLDTAISLLKKSGIMFLNDQNWEEYFDVEYFLGKIYFKKSEYTHAFFHLSKADEITNKYIGEDFKIKNLIRGIKSHIERTGEN